jgi:NAD(P)-dependent dehydrogenase (short-subunit alcohol dehydrogenase family)
VPNGSVVVGLALAIDLSGKVAIVTGAGVGIGAEIARTMARCGAAVALTYHTSGAGARQVAAEIEAAGGRAMTFHCDTRNVAEIQATVEAVLRALGTVDILVNNAGLTDPHPVLELTEEDWDRTLDANLKGMFFFSQAFARACVAQHKPGAIVNLSSIHGTRAYANHTHYAASKAAIDHMTRSLAVNLAPYRIRVNAIAPGAVEVPRFYRDPNYSSEAVGRRIPLGRVGQPSDIAPLACFLASDLSSWTSGAVVHVTGASGL